jgi:hypothetical protein
LRKFPIIEKCLQTNISGHGGHQTFTIRTRKRFRSGCGASLTREVSGSVSLALNLDRCAYAPGEEVDATGSYAQDDTKQVHWAFMGVRMHVLFEAYVNTFSWATHSKYFQTKHDFILVKEILPPGRRIIFSTHVLPPIMPPSFDGTGPRLHPALMGIFFAGWRFCI